MSNDKSRKRMLFLSLTLLLPAVVLWSLAVGQVPVPAETVMAIIGQKLHIAGLTNSSISPEQTAVIWHIRLPRVLAGLLAGAALAVSGAVLQGIFSNPLADPGIIGVSSGASLGAVIAIATGVTAYNVLYMPFFALIGAMLAVMLIVGLTMRHGKISVMLLLLSGVAVSMLLGAMTSGILTFMNEQRIREFLFWLVGGLDYRRWEHVYMTVGPVMAGIISLCFVARHLNVLILGEQEARSVGMPVNTLRFFLLLAASLTTAAAVCITGTIGFVGLVIPHILRLIIGPEHRALIPACALAGGLFLVFCDTLGRLILQPLEIRVGIMTALIGAPYFLYLLYKAQRKGELS
ncbi:hypothetical protein P22_0722 [Propionispora sp. 2/2-37]|uniref:FecCD family ABC transporter permease n=1 Tax=Propionispora sp. 2/2-37 TaxID=1677858 RepID=UPI0006BB84EF|nr:iron ABC transporter permease [Propionispora sp. 2/2-37]CUH94656.1 hypothetical protein P22_0722 [Propionispora sp. 2/2-37]